MKFYKRLTTVLAGVILAVSSIMGVGFAPLVSAASGSDTCVWTGAGDGTTFSDVSNWSNCSSAAPVNGDTIKFTQLASDASSTTHTIDVPMDSSTKLAGILVDPTQTTPDVVSTYNFSGSALNLAAGATISSTDTSAASIGAKLGSLSVLHAYGDLTIDDGFSSIWDFYNNNNLGQIDGNLVVSSYISAFYGLNAHVTGQLQVQKNAYVKLDLANFSAASIDVADGGSLYLGAAGNKDNASDLTKVSSSIPITLDGGNLYVNASQLYSETWSDAPTTTYTLSGDLTLNGDSGIYTDKGVTVKFTGKINKNGHSLTNDSSSSGEVYLAGKQLVNPSKTTKLTGDEDNCYTGEGCYTVGQSDTAVLDGSRVYVSVFNGGILKGDGSTDNLSVKYGGTVAPGHSPGKLTVVNTLTLAGGSIYQAELKDSKAGDYDQLSVTGKNPGYTVDNYVTLGDFDGSTGKQTGFPILDVSLYKGYSIKKGDKFTIIDNKSKTDVKGIFKDLKEGATLKVDGFTFKISYKGGDGNDVVLTTESVPAPTEEKDAPKAPDTGFALTSSNSSLIAAAVVLIAGVIAVIAGKTRKLVSRR